MVDETVRLGVRFRVLFSKPKKEGSRLSLRVLVDWL